MIIVKAHEKSNSTFAQTPREIYDFYWIKHFVIIPVILTQALQLICNLMKITVRLRAASLFELAFYYSIYSFGLFHELRISGLA